MQLFALGSSLTSPCIVRHPLPHASSLASSLPRDHLTDAKEKTVWSSDEWSSHALRPSHYWAKGKSAFLLIHIALSATARIQGMTVATVPTHAPADIAGALTIVIMSAPLPTLPAPPPNALFPSTISMWALSAPPPSLLETTPMNLTSLRETTMETSKGMSLIESRGSASLGGASCYDPQTCRAPIFLFPSRPLSLLTHLCPLPFNSHRPLPIYSVKVQDL